MLFSNNKNILKKSLYLKLVEQLLIVFAMFINKIKINLNNIWLLNFIIILNKI